MSTPMKCVLHVFCTMVAIACLTLPSEAQLAKKKNPPATQPPVAQPMPITPDVSTQPAPPAVRPSPKAKPKYVDPIIRPKGSSDFLINKMNMDAQVNAARI